MQTAKKFSWPTGIKMEGNGEPASLATESGVCAMVMQLWGPLRVHADPQLFGGGRMGFQVFSAAGVCHICIRKLSIPLF
jgi:hypothetical protein